MKEWENNRISMPWWYLSPTTGELTTLEQLMWITKLSQIPEASKDDLKRSLITEDGMGKVIKKAALERLLAITLDAGTTNTSPIPSEKKD